eukprot:m.184991 g.184991  ORF g.184991 m.184991 type:complete len:186 (-) comp10513_c0_seq6:2543-3100(-)
MGCNKSKVSPMSPQRIQRQPSDEFVVQRVAAAPAANQTMESQQSSAVARLERDCEAALERAAALEAQLEATRKDVIVRHDAPLNERIRALEAELSLLKPDYASSTNQQSSAALSEMLERMQKDLETSQAETTRLREKVCRLAACRFPQLMPGSTRKKSNACVSTPPRSALRPHYKSLSSRTKLRA